MPGENRAVQGIKQEAGHQTIKSLLIIISYTITFFFLFFSLEVIEKLYYYFSLK